MPASETPRERRRHRLPSEPRKRRFTLKFRTVAAAGVVATGIAVVATVAGMSDASAAGRLLMVSSSPDRSNAQELSGTTQSGDVYMFVNAIPKTTQITFYLDDDTSDPISVERSAPWDLAATAADGEAQPYDLSKLTPGQHRITYQMNFDGKTVLNGAYFTVAASSGVSTPVSTTDPAPSSGTTSPTTPPAGGNTGTATPTSGATSTPTNLDHTGTALPDTNYSIPDGTVFMATDGSDSNPGTQAQPFQTLNKAVSAAPNGGTIVLRGGTYRDWYTSGGLAGTISKSLTFQAYPHEQVWLSGADKVSSSSFTSDGNGHYYMDWATPSFCMGKYYARALKSPSKTPNNDQCAYWDSSLDSANPMAVDPQMVFANGSYIHEVQSLSQATGSNFYYDQSAKRVYLGFSPAGKNIELTKRPTALNLYGNNSKILGIGFKDYASNFYGNNTTGAVYNKGSNLLIENSAFVQNAGPGFSGSLQKAVVRHTAFIDNGANGITSNGHYRQNTADDVVIENSLFDGNNAERFDVGCSASCAAANIKLNHTLGATVRNNIIENAGGEAKGVWCDLACNDVDIVNNTVTGNGADGIFYEVSDNGIIASNLVQNNKGRGISIGSADTKVYNNTILGQEVSLRIYDDQRSYGVDGWTDVGPDTKNLSVANNVVAGTDNMINCGPPMLKAGKNQAPNTGCSQFFSLLDYNSYQQAAPGGSVSFKFANLGQSKETVYKSLSSFESATGHDDHSSGSVAAAAAALKAASLSASLTAGSTAALPSDVVKALGLASGAGIDRGAVSYPGS